MELFWEIYGIRNMVGISVLGFYFGAPVLRVSFGSLILQDFYPACKLVSWLPIVLLKLDWPRWHLLFYLWFAVEKDIYYLNRQLLYKGRFRGVQDQWIVRIQWHSMSLVKEKIKTKMQMICEPCRQPVQSKRPILYVRLEWSHPNSVWKPKCEKVAAQHRKD